MRQVEVTRGTGATRDELRYFEAKGYVHPRSKEFGIRTVRDYSDEDVELIRLIVKFRRQRFELDAAFEKARMELQNPRLV